MAWADENRDNNTSTSDWLKFPQLKSPGDKAEIRIRILEEAPADAWQHWLEGRPYNCHRPECPVCQVRMRAREVDPERAKNDYPMRQRFFFNVLVDEDGVPVVKVFGFGGGLARDLKAFSEAYRAKHGPLTAYDIIVRKSQIGRLPMNVEYSIFFDGTRELSAAEREAAANLHDLRQFAKPASLDVLRSVAQGKVPEVIEDESARLLGEIKSHIPADVDLSHFDIDVNNPPSAERLEATLRALRGE